MIKFLDLHKINERFRGELDAAAKRVLDSGWYLLGKENEAFEREFAAYCGVKHTIGCANGLDALKLIIRAYGFGPGDEVIAPANTYIASLIAISANGATPGKPPRASCVSRMSRVNLWKNLDVSALNAPASVKTCVSAIQPRRSLRCGQSVGTER